MKGGIIGNRGRSVISVYTVGVAVLVSMAGLFLFVLSLTEGRGQGRDVDTTVFRERHPRSVSSNATLVIPDDMWKTVYKYDEFKTKYPSKNPTICFTKKGLDDNGTTFYNFTCPMTDQGPEMSECCGPSDSQHCCKKKKDDSTNNDLDIITAVSIIAAFVVSISLCLVLYCCCCQRRGELHSGRLIWIKKKKNKMIYEEGGVSPGGSVGDPDEDDVELVGFIPVPDRQDPNHSPLGSRKSIDVAIAEAEKHQKEKEKEHHAKHKEHKHGDHGNHHHHHHHGNRQHDNDPKEKEIKHEDKDEVSPDLNIPSINVQPSTPEPPADDNPDDKTDDAA